jgi:hypothetical protein
MFMPIADAYPQENTKNAKAEPILESFEVAFAVAKVAQGTPRRTPRR